jgi:hypothetical protein
VAVCDTAEGVSWKQLLHCCLLCAAIYILPTLEQVVLQQLL